MLPRVVPVLPWLQFLPRLRGAKGLEHGGQEVLPALGGGGVRGDDHHLHLHHQEEHLQAAHGLPGGRILRGGRLSRGLLSVLARLGLGDVLHVSTQV